jgi:cytochrome c-type biogenesis protein CcmH/NrfG
MKRAIVLALMGGLLVGVLGSTDSAQPTTFRSVLSGGDQVPARDTPARGVAIFRLNVEQYPESANAWDSLGEGYLAAGDRALAEEAYAKSLELDPENENAREKLDEIRGG